VKLVDAPEVGGVHDVPLTVRVGNAPDCVTLIVRVKKPALTVTVAERDTVDGFAEAVSHRVEPNPEAVSHDWLLLNDHDDSFVLTVKLVEPPQDEGDHKPPLIVRVGEAPVCVTEIVRLTHPAVTVTVAFRLVVPGFDAAVSHNDDPNPETVSHG